MQVIVSIAETGFEVHLLLFGCFEWSFRRMTAFELQVDLVALQSD